MCLHGSSLLLPVCGLRANTCENSGSQIISLAFSTAKTLVSKGLSKKGQKARGFCRQSRDVLQAVCTACLQSGDAGGERVLLNHMILPVWQVSAVWVEKPTVHYFGWMRLALTASGPTKKSTHLLISSALHTGCPNAYSCSLKQWSFCLSLAIVGRKILPRALLVLIFRCWLSGFFSAYRTSLFWCKHSLGI